ncbi:MAG: hypothetical protein HY017_33945 [Betaproteobacteria bacterium]|nr:hypothetical protein [Betaproteobacteria bacterium]
MNARILTAIESLPAELVRWAVDGKANALVPLDQARRAFEHEYLVHILTMTRGNVTHAARLAGRNRTEFYRLLERHVLEPAAFKRIG